MAGRDLSIRHRIKPEPLTERELNCIENVPDLDFEVFRHKIHMITLECKETCMKLGASTGMRWGDLGISIYTASGDSAACATGIWFHTMLGQIPLKYILKHWGSDPSVGIKEGDSFFCNDPIYGGVHTPDMMQYMPVFHQGELVCWVGCVVHSGETGASEPGGAPLTAKSRYDEGIHIPPMKIGENFRLREDVINTFAHMVRDPRSLILDIKARAAACAVGRRRILEVIEKKGVDFFIGALRKLIRDNGEAARKKVSMLNDGIYRQPRMLDTVGMEDALVKFMITIRKEGDKLHLDVTDSSPEIPDKPINSHFLGILGISAVYLCGYLFYDLPANSGLMEVLEWHFPENIVLNPFPESPTCLSPWTQVICEHGIAQIGSKMLFPVDPQRAVAAWFKGFNMAYFGGMNQYGEPLADVGAEMNAGGLGARPDMDGVNVAGAFFAALSDSGDVEAIEVDRPFIYPFRKFFQDSFGFGKFRGGTGLDYGLMVHHVPWLFMGGVGFGSKLPTTIGLFGGYSIPTFVAIKVKQNNWREMYTKSDRSLPFSTQDFLEKNSVDGKVEVWPISCPGEVLMNGDVFIAAVGGGAGYGDVLERDPELVMKDLKDGLISHWAVQNIFHISYDQVTLRCNVEETQVWRNAEREARKQRGLTFREFEQQWSKQRPPAQVLRYYGNWPNPSIPS